LAPAAMPLVGRGERLPFPSFSMLLIAAATTPMACLPNYQDCDKVNARWPFTAPSLEVT
jgi:hypothetical protein